MDEGAEYNADLWATAAESRDEIVDLYQRVWEHADATISGLPLDASGRVPWWREYRHRLEQAAREVGARQGSR